MKYNVIVETEVEVEVDEKLFTKDVMSDFNNTFVDVGYDIKKHAAVIGKLVALGRYEDDLSRFGLNVTVGDSDAYCSGTME